MNWKNRLLQRFVTTLRPRALNPVNQKKFLILSTTGLGDTLWGTPALRSLRKQFPSSYIAVVTSPIGHEVLLHNRRIDDLFVVKDPVLPHLIRLYRKLRAKNFSHVLSFHVSQRPMLPFGAILGAHEIIGTKGLHKGLDFLLTQALEQKECHEIERRMQIAASAGAHPLDRSMELFISPEDINRADHVLEQLEIPSYLPLIGMHPGAKDKFKQWPPSHYIDLGNRLTQHLGCKILVTGTPAEKSLAEHIASHISGASAITNLPLRSTAALIKRLDLFITNDTGPMHVAFAMKTPTIAPFCPTNPQLCGPYFAENSLAIAKKITCFPCLSKKCQEPFCMLQIGVDEVYNAAVGLFYKSKGVQYQ